MNHAETTALLAICASFDNRKPNPESVTSWLAALGDLDFAAARDAVIDYYQTNRDWIMPADVRGRVHRERVSRIEDDVIPMPPGLDPDDTAAYIRVLRAGRRALAEGRDLPESQGLTRRNLRELGPAPVATIAETDAAERAEGMTRLREARAAAVSELKAARTERPAPPQPVCEAAIPDDTASGYVICELPATDHALTDTGRRYPTCAEHAVAEGGAA